MKISIYQIDAFTDNLFGGNPAAICILKEWLSDEVLLKIAQENNLAETAYLVKKENGQYHLRWFTPEIEMDLCGHATLAAAFVLFDCLNYGKEVIEFDTASGILKVKKIGEMIEMNFPSRPPVKSTLPIEIQKGLNIQPIEV